jgi:hypothetical protein
MQIMSSDIIAKQGDIVFGQLPDRMTADVEAGESSFGHWRDGTDHFWYPWIGVVERGSTTKLWIQPLGVTQSKGEPRVPPLAEDAWNKVCQNVFTPSSGVVLTTDGAQAYRHTKHPGIVRHEWVNHSAKDFSAALMFLHVHRCRCHAFWDGWHTTHRPAMGFDEASNSPRPE